MTARQFVSGRRRPARSNSVRSMEGHGQLVAFVWAVADLLRGDYKQSEYGRVILPLVVLRRLDCVLEPTKEAVLKRHGELAAKGIENVDPALHAVAGQGFYNTSPLDLGKVLGDPAN